MKNIVLITGLLFLFVNCKKEKNTSLTVTVNKDVPEVKNNNISIKFSQAKSKIKLSDIVIKESFEVIPLETKENSLIGNIDKVVFTDDYIFVFDWLSSRAIFQFDTSGNFIRKIGKQGQGPGEYLMIYDFDVYNNKLIVLDMGYKLIYYTLEGEYVNQTELKDFVTGKLISLNKDLLAFNTTGSEPYELTIATPKGEVKNQYLPKLKLRKPLGINSLYKTANRTYFKTTYNDTVYKILESGNMISDYYIDYGNKALKIKEFEGLANADQKLKKNLYKYCNTVSLFDNNNFRYLTFTYNNELWINIHNNRTNTNILTKKENIENDITLEKSSYIIGTKNNKFVFLVQPQDLLLELSHNKDNTYSNEYVNRIKKIIKEKEITEEDNPILVLYTFKS